MSVSLPKCGVQGGEGNVLHGWICPFPCVWEGGGGGGGRREVGRREERRGEEKALADGVPTSVQTHHNKPTLNKKLNKDNLHESIFASVYLSSLIHLIQLILN